MDVYLVPVGATRYELYCEVPDEPDEAGVDEPPRGFFRRTVHRFHETIAEAERERRHGKAAGPPRGWFGRVRARTLRWVAESIAEQKLLWHLRKQDAASFHYPDDLQEGPAVAIRREQLGRDYKKHRFWLAIDSTLMVVLGVGLFFIPGPNIIGYYFAFRVVGHYLSLRGAARGLNAIEWRNQASAPLTELRRLLTLDPGVREPRLHAVAEMLRLEHLVSFFERSAVST
jgi:Mitochondrial K+-H+ exchange-related